MKALIKKAAIGFAATSMVVAAPASATIFEYTFNDGDVLTIDTDAGTGSWVGEDINATFSSPDFASFQGGASPSLSATLTSISGSRLINGAFQPVSSNPRHPEMLITRNGGERFNLWANWGNPIVGGDYVRRITDFTATEVPAPGMLGLFGLALIALGLGRRRRSKVTAA
ncbi:MAG: PEP-CTERM sorting domain-containing protein [Erythrobacter sp.]